MGYNYNRAGGAQLPSPALGWIWGLTDYEVDTDLFLLAFAIFSQRLTE